MTMKRKMTMAERERFLFCDGEFYAALGGTFSAYREATEAFESAVKFKPYAELELGSMPTDFEAFEKGFLEFQKLRIAMQLEQARREAEMKELLASLELHAPNYLYEKVEHYTDLAGWRADNPQVTDAERAALKAQALAEYEVTKQSYADARKET